MGFIENISPENLSDAELLHRFRTASDSKTLATLYTRYMELVYGVCLKYLRDPESSKDAVMEIYEELWRKVAQHDITNFRSWLYTVARNHCLMKLRGMKAIVVNIDEERMQFADNVHQESVRDKESAFVILDECVQKLPPEQKQAITLFYLKEKCYNDIAETTGFEWNKVRSLVQNGRRNLKICMEKLKESSAERMQ